MGVWLGVGVRGCAPKAGRTDETKESARGVHGTPAGQVVLHESGLLCDKQSSARLCEKMLEKTFT